MTHSPRDPRLAAHPPLLLGRGKPSDESKGLVGASSLWRTHLEVRQVQTNLASPLAGQGRMHQLQGEHMSKAGLAQQEKGGQNQAPVDIGLRDAVGPSGDNRGKLPPQSYFRLYTHIASHSTLFGGHNAGNGHISSRHPHQWGHSIPHTLVVHSPRTGPPSHWWQSQ